MTLETDSPDAWAGNLSATIRNGRSKTQVYFVFLPAASFSRNERSSSSAALRLMPAKTLSLAITFSIALTVIQGKPGISAGDQRLHPGAPTFAETIEPDALISNLSSNSLAVHLQYSINCRKLP